ALDRELQAAGVKTVERPASAAMAKQALFRYISQATASRSIAGVRTAMSHCRIDRFGSARPREITDAERNSRPRADILAAPRPVRPHLPLLPGLGNEEGQQAAVRALRAARSPVL